MENTESNTEKSHSPASRVERIVRWILKQLVKLRYTITILIIGRMPVCMNMKISRPDGYSGALFKQKAGEYGIFSRNYIDGEEDGETIMRSWSNKDN